MSDNLRPCPFCGSRRFARIFTAEKGTQTTTSTMFIARIAPRAARLSQVRKSSLVKTDGIRRAKHGTGGRSDEAAQLVAIRLVCLGGA